MGKWSPRARYLLLWHGWPVALWFLWPGKLASFLWVLSPTSNPGGAPHHDLLGGYLYYWECLAGDYHVGVWSALAVLLLFVAAVTASVQARLRPGTTVVLWLSLIAVILTAEHPNRGSRFLHSWIPVVWVTAGIGAGSLARPEAGRGASPFGRGSVAAWGVLVLWHLPGLGGMAHAPEGGIHPDAPCILDVTDSYLPALAHARRPAVLSNMPMKFLAQWTYLQRYRRSQQLETDIPDFDPDARNNTLAFGRWLATTPCDTVVYLDFPPGTTFYTRVTGEEGLGQMKGLLENQRAFKPVHRQTFPQYGCSVTTWRRQP